MTWYSALAAAAAYCSSALKKKRRGFQTQAAAGCTEACGGKLRSFPLPHNNHLLLRYPSFCGD